MVAKRVHHQVVVPLHGKQWRLGQVAAPSGLFVFDVDWRVNHICDVDSWRWTQRANCADTDPDDWFPNPKDGVEHLAEICQDCPVKRECLSIALERDEWGYWAGTTRAERSQMLGKRRRQPTGQ